jgi:hypothetical protein
MVKGEGHTMNNLEQDLVYKAWRNSEAYQVPMTVEGEEAAMNRYYSFKKGWEYAKFHTDQGHIDMKHYLENL